MSRLVAVALLHHPVLDRQADVVTTAITNLDLHDIARSAYTYGAERFFVTHPVEAQRTLALRVKAHWVGGSGARRIPDREPPMSRLEVVTSLDAALERLPEPVEVWATTAAESETRLGYGAARELLARGTGSVVLVFGTGWGLAPSVFERAAHVLEPIRSPRADGYNHLSVRAAVAITLDRLLGNER